MRSGSPTGSTPTPRPAIRDATVADAAAIGRVHGETWRATYAGLIPDDVIERVAATPVSVRAARLAAQPARAFTLVAEADGEIVAFASAGPSRDDPAEAEVYAIYVLPAHQGRGTGAALVREAARRLGAHGLRGLVIWVLRENRSGRAFYERMGGSPERLKDDVIGGFGVVEIGYVWTDPGALSR